MKSRTMIKDKYRKIVTDMKEVLQVWQENFKTLLNKREERERELHLPSAVEGN